MALTIEEEQRLRELLAISPSLLDIGDKSTEIEAALGYEEVRVVDLPTAQPLANSDVMYVAQQSTDVKATVQQFGAFVLDAYLNSNPTAVTPPQFDDDTSIATTRFVQRASGNHSGIVIFGSGGAQTLTAADAGKLVVLGGAATGTLRLPLASTVSEGTSFKVKLESVATWTVLANGTDGASIRYGNSSFSNISIYPDEDITFTKAGSVWRTSGPGILRHASSLASLKDPIGYKMDLSGELEQWGTAVSIAGANGTEVTFPIAFPNACHNIVANTYGATELTQYPVIAIGEYDRFKFRFFASPTPSAAGSNIFNQLIMFQAYGR